MPLFAILILMSLAPSANATTIEEALNALGGKEKLTSIPLVVVVAKGVEHRSAEMQGFSPDGETTAQHEMALVLYPSSEKLVYEHRTGRPDGTVRWRRWRFDGDDVTVADFMAEFASRNRNPNARRDRLRLARAFPHMLLLEAASATPRAIDGRNIEFVPTGEKTPLRLSFDDHHLLSSFRYATNYGGLGDIPVEHSFHDYTPHAQLGLVPSRHEIRANGRLFRVENYTSIATEPAAAERYTALPERLRSSLAGAGDVTEVAPGVFIIQRLGGFTPMFVEFDDFIVAIEAPSPAQFTEYTPADSPAGASALGEQMVDIIRARVPGKPIRHIIVTHFHGDHSGGARAFIAEGASVVATRGNEEFIRAMTAAPHEIVPDRLARAPRPLVLTFVERELRITDGQRELMVYNVGANPHTTEMLVVWLPRERILYQGDLVYYSGSLAVDAGREKVLDFFVNWAEKQKITPAKIYGLHSSTYVTGEEAVAMHKRMH